MGMFDYLQVDDKWLPEDARRPYEEQGFQTKDFDNALEIYSITEKGTILKWDPDESFIPVAYEGEIRFYDFFDKAEGGCCLREFIADVKNDFVINVKEV